MKYKLLALDLDGTLLNRERKVTEHTRRTLLEAQECGVKIALTSGRPTYGMASVADRLEMKKYGGYVLSFNGGEITNWQTGERLYEKTLDPDLLPCLHQYARAHRYALVTYKGKYVLSERPDDEYALKAAVLDVMVSRKVENFLEAVTFPVAKCLMAGNPTRLAASERELQARLKGRMDVFRSEPHFLELVPKGVNKAQSLTVLLDKIGLPKEDTIAIGDGFNDLPLIQLAGLGVAMANAREEVRRQADYVTLSNDNDGVAAVVEKFILSNSEQKTRS